MSVLQELSDTAFDSLAAFYQPITCYIWKFLLTNSNRDLNNFLSDGGTPMSETITSM